MKPYNKRQFDRIDVPTATVTFLGIDTLSGTTLKVVDVSRNGIAITVPREVIELVRNVKTAYLRLKIANSVHPCDVHANLVRIDKESKTGVRVSYAISWLDDVALKLLHTAGDYHRLVESGRYG